MFAFAEDNLRELCESNSFPIPDNGMAFSGLCNAAYAAG